MDIGQSAVQITDTNTGFSGMVGVYLGKRVCQGEQMHRVRLGHESNGTAYVALVTACEPTSDWLNDH